MKFLLQLTSLSITWYNLPFTMSLLAFLGLSLMQFIGLDQDPEADPDVDLEADLDAFLDADADADIDADAGLDADYNLSDALSWTHLLEFLGVGKAPVTMILLLLLGSFGLMGWILNTVVLQALSIYPAWVLAPVSAFSLIAGSGFTSRTARLIGRLVPAIATTATSKERLVGRLGRVTSPQVDESFGLVKVRDAGGTSITVFAVIDPGQAPIVRESNVFLVEYDPLKKLFVVVSSEIRDWRLEIRN